jgi:hypothetical protein
MAMVTELNALAKNSIWDLTLLPPDAHIIGCKWYSDWKENQMVQFKGIKLF